jgi:glutathione S-transferase
VIRLYRAPHSTNCERVTLALAHKGLSEQVDSVWIEYSDRSPVVAVSGQGLVPVIDHDGTVVADSLAILHYLEEQVPEPALFPGDQARRAELELFLDWFDRVWKVEPNAIEAELGAAAPDHGRVAELGAVMDARLDRFEALLEGREFLMGEFSAADCAAYPFLKYAAGRPADDPDLFHHICDEHQTLDGRPALAEWIRRVASR